MIFVDTSALFAVLDRDDQALEPARAAWTGWLSDEREISLLTSYFVLVDSFALLQSSFGMEAVCAFHDDLLPVLQVHWTTSEDHDIATQALLLAGRRRMSLVDCTSFQLMRRLGVSRAFAFDRQFAEQGFEVLPGQHLDDAQRKPGERCACANRRSRIPLPLHSGHLLPRLKTGRGIRGLRLL